MDGLAGEPRGDLRRVLRDRRRTAPPVRPRARASRSRWRSQSPASCRSTCGRAAQRSSWMGDSGSQLIGFTLAALGLASSYTVASSTVATLVLPVLVLAVPILDTTLVTIVRLLDGRPIVAGRPRPQLAPPRVARSLRDRRGRAAGAHRRPRSARRASRTRRSASGRVAAIGVLVTFALLVQFGSFLADVDRGAGVRRSLLRHTAGARRGARRRRADRGVVPRGVPAPVQRPRHVQPAPLSSCSDAPGDPLLRATSR